MSASPGRSERKRITFDDFGVVSTAAALSIGLNPRVKPLWVRMTFLAMSRSNRIGHARFAPGELGALLAGPHRRDPEIHHTPTSQQLRGAIDLCIDNGMLEVDSGIRCLRLNVDLWEKKGGGGKNEMVCPDHYRVRQWPRSH